MPDVSSSALKAIYHRLVPAAIRYPLGHWRRGMIDRWVRLRTGGPPLPPRRLLQSVQMTPWVWEYLEVGERSADAVRDALGAAGLDASDRAEVLDFGCGLGRTLRALRSTSWQLHGCDVDATSIEWVRSSLPTVTFEVNDTTPPLLYPADSFDGLYAISVFTHFDTGDQAAWAAELGRIVRPGGLAAISTMGPHALGGFPNLATKENRRILVDGGFLYIPARPEPLEDREAVLGRRPDGTFDARHFNAQGAFHHPDEIRRLFAPWFEVVAWNEAGIDGFQDLTVLRRRRDESVDTGPGST